MDAADISFEVCRPVEAHARLVMAWRNDPVALKVSFHQEPKVWETFWPEYCTTYVAAPPLPVFALNEGRRVAFLRFRPCADPRGWAGRVVDISINVAPEYRGRGFGAAILKAALRHLGAEGIDAVCAEIRVDNAQSVRTFKNAGYERFGDTEKLIEDTGETCRIHTLIAEITPPFWRHQGVYVIAEAGSNWRMGTPKRDMAMAQALIDVAVAAGADAVKFQTYRPESVYVANAGHSDYLSKAGITENVQDIFADLAMPYEMIGELAAYSKKCGIDFMSTGFSIQDLEAIDPFVPIHKIASYEISHRHLIDFVARTGKPLVLSTGASNLEDIAWAIDRFQAGGGGDLCVLQCTASYPAPMESLNLWTLPQLQRRFGIAVGLSDHSRDPATAPVAAVALGARVIEKHYTLDNRLPGPDHPFALLPEELSTMIAKVRAAELSLGNGAKEVLDAEKELAAYARRGLQATRAIRRGEVLKEGSNFAILRPGKQTLGAHPRHLEAVEGRIAARDIAAGSGVSLADIQVP
ncbi:MAG: GNAT family N-acetyltransferase [Rhodospirillaceae bacterium]|nr:MAG: GNAT family N-acetyltransferase [Rhodospirillaceae bacterium]